MNDKGEKELDKSTFWELANMKDNFDLILLSKVRIDCILPLKDIALFDHPPPPILYIES